MGEVVGRMIIYASVCCGCVVWRNSPLMWRERGRHVKSQLCRTSGCAQAEAIIFFSLPFSNIADTSSNGNYIFAK